MGSDEDLMEIERAIQALTDARGLVGRGRQEAALSKVREALGLCEDAEERLMRPIFGSSTARVGGGR